jgi:hypothetical protein
MLQNDAVANNFRRELAENGRYEPENNSITQDWQYWMRLQY